ncbi:hypothetical protein AHF37_12325 [Paragonimus kellicotti]|nr:hypothetical protein AHF37_12325 [Paragonimus kellicotti]
METDFTRSELNSIAYYFVNFGCPLPQLYWFCFVWIF